MTATVVQDSIDPNSWILSISNADHNRLTAMGESEGRSIASTASKDLGLSRFVAVNTNDQGNPVGNTRWYVKHTMPHGQEKFTVLADAINDLLAPGRLAAIQAIIAQMRTEKGLSEQEVADLFRTTR
jgi:hypothetical protein